MKNESKKKNIVTVAAHSDDTALCLGGYLSEFDGGIEIINVFSTCACSVMKGLKTPEEITCINNQEEEQFAEKIGAKLNFLNENEVLLRGYPYWSGEIIENIDKELIIRIAKKIESEIIKADEVYFPIGIGNHVDHKILFNIGQTLVKKGYPILFYEDLPYAPEIGNDKLQTYLKNFSCNQLIDITGSIGKKLELCAIYRTQYDGDYLKILKDYANNLEPKKPRNYYERVWKI